MPIKTNSSVSFVKDNKRIPTFLEGAGRFHLHVQVWSYSNTIAIDACTKKVNEMNYCLFPCTLILTYSLRRLERVFPWWKTLQDLQRSLKIFIRIFVDPDDLVRSSSISSKSLPSPCKDPSGPCKDPWGSFRSLQRSLRILQVPARILEDPPSLCKDPWGPCKDPWGSFRSLQGSLRIQSLCKDPWGPCKDPWGSSRSLQGSLRSFRSLQRSLRILQVPAKVLEDPSGPCRDPWGSSKTLQGSLNPSGPCKDPWGSFRSLQRSLRIPQVPARILEGLSGPYKDPWGSFRFHYKIQPCEKFVTF